MSSTIAEIDFIIQQLNIYVGLVIFITGVIGGLLNIVIFTTLKTFRETSCGFYLTITSICNVGQAIFGLTTRFLDSGFLINLTNLPWSCKLRTFLAQSCILLSLTGMSLVTIDQYLSMTTYRHFSSLKLAHRHIMIACGVWGFHGIFALIYSDTPAGICTPSAIGYLRYISDFYLPILLGCLPIFIMVTFSSLAFFNIRTLASRRLNIVRLSRDRQLTAMALLQVVFIVFASIPYTVFNIYDLNTMTIDQEESAHHRLIDTIVVLLYCEQFASSFYIFCCVSKRFRRQLIYVLLKIHTNSLQKLTTKVTNNQITPDLDSAIDKQIGRPNVTVHDIALRNL